MTTLRAYGICTTCFEPYPASRGCPACDDDVEAAEEVAAATAIAFAAESPNRLRAEHRAGISRRRQATSLVAVLSLTLACGLLFLVLVQ